eukprot:3017096-Amphidinium_carterae.1
MACSDGSQFGICKHMRAFQTHCEEMHSTSITPQRYTWRVLHRMEGTSATCPSLRLLLDATWSTLRRDFHHSILAWSSDPNTAYAARTEISHKRRRTDEDLRAQYLQSRPSSSSQGVLYQPSQGRELAWTHRLLLDYIGAARQKKCGDGHLSIAFDGSRFGGEETEMLL